MSDNSTIVERREAFREIYEAHHGSLCAYFARRVGRDQAEDLAAETFVVAWRKMPRRLEQPLPWLYAVAGHVLANHRRVARLAPPRAPRRGRRLLAIPAAGVAALIAALAVLPASAPQASEIIRRASTAIDAAAGDVLYAQIRVRRDASDGSSTSYGTRREWVRQAAGEPAPAMRSLQTAGAGDGPVGTEEVSRPSPGHGETDRYSPATGEVSSHPGIELTLWVDRETYPPLQLTDHSFGRDANGDPFDEMLTETVEAFERLPDTAENRRLLEMSPHPQAGG